MNNAKFLIEMKASLAHFGNNTGQPSGKAHDGSRVIPLQAHQQLRETLRENNMKGLPSGKQDVSHGPLLDLLLGEIVPRLAGSKPSASSGGHTTNSFQSASRAPGQAPPSSSGAEAEAPSPTFRLPLQHPALSLSRLAVAGNLRGAAELLDRQRLEGRSLAEILLDVVQPAARELGRGWDSDEMSFSDVTVGIGVLRRSMAEQIDRHAERTPPPELAAQAPCVLFAALPGCQHRFGLTMVGAIFELAGWRVTVAEEQSEDSLLERIREHRPNLFGLSLGSDFEIDPAAAFILRVRHVSHRFNPVMMVGGPVVFARPHRVAEIGADLVCADARDALKGAARYLKEPRLEST